MAGRPPKPTRLKILEGNPGRRELNASEPHPTDGHVICPSWIDSYARRQWTRVLPTLPSRLITDADVDMLALYCQAIADIRRYRVYLRRAGETYTTSTGRLAARPEIAMLAKARSDAVKLSNLLGLNPSARSRLSVPEQDDGGLDALLGDA